MQFRFRCYRTPEDAASVCKVRRWPGMPTVKLFDPPLTLALKAVVGALRNTVPLVDAAGPFNVSTPGKTTPAAAPAAAAEPAASVRRPTRWSATARPASG